MAAGAILGRQVPRREAAGGADAKTRRVAPSRSAKLQAWSSSAADEIRRGRGRRALGQPPRSAELEAGELERRRRDSSSSSAAASRKEEGGSDRRRGGGAAAGGGAGEEVPPAWGEVVGNGWLVRRGKKAVEGSRDKIFF